MLPRALLSLREQNSPLKVAFLDASGDSRVAEAADSCGLEFSYRRHGRDAGQAAAIREGWERIGGDVLFWLNADDQLLPNTLSRVRAILEACPKADVVYGGAEFIDIAGKRIGLHDQVGEMSRLILRSNIIAQPSCFARRRAVEAVGGIDPELHFVMDWDLWVRLYCAGAHFQRVDRLLSAIYIGNGTKTEQVSRRRLAETFALVRRNAGIWTAAKSTASLAVHTLVSRQRTVVA